MSFLSNRNPRERLLILLCTVVVVVAVVMVLNPADGSAKKLVPAAEATKKSREYVQQARDMILESDELKKRIARASQTKPVDEVVPEMVIQLAKLAKDAGLHLREIKPIRAKRIAGLTRIPVTVRLTTEFPKCIPFLYSIEDPAGKLVIDRLNVSATDAKSREVDIEVMVSAFTQDAGQKPDTL